MGLRRCENWRFRSCKWWDKQSKALCACFQATVDALEADADCSAGDCGEEGGSWAGVLAVFSMLASVGIMVLMMVYIHAELEGIRKQQREGEGRGRKYF